jgi:ubiquinone/menaquinone biosynthesis C-methylase UbiE
VNRKDFIRAQFDKQAEKFSSWGGTGDERGLQQLFDFIGFSGDAELLDVACGSGQFAIFCAGRIQRAHGVDISPKMIGLARKAAAASALHNVSFECHDVEHLPCATDSFSVVSSRAAFHHMDDYLKVFEEMVRCCRRGGSVCIDDLTTYDTAHVTDFFDKLDTLIDRSHNARVSQQALRDLFALNAIEIVKTAVLEFKVPVQLYASHALQSDEDVKEIDRLLQRGLQDAQISKFLYEKDNEVVFRNIAFRIAGRKAAA